MVFKPPEILHFVNPDPGLAPEACKSAFKVSGARLLMILPINLLPVLPATTRSFQPSWLRNPPRPPSSGPPSSRGQACWYLHAIRTVLPGRIDRGSGQILNMSSIAGIAELAAVGVSYLVMPGDDIDLGAMLAQLGERLRITRVLLEGGATMNGALLNAGLVDEEA